MIVERAQAITDFTKEKFYTVEINYLDIKAVSARIPDKENAEITQNACNGNDAVIKRVERTKKTVLPPKLYDLTALQREANRIFGYTAQQALDCVQALYEKSLCTYPRTDSRYITGDMQDSIPRLAAKISAVFPPFNCLDLASNVGQIVDDSSVNDHHAILPTIQIADCNLDALPSAERNILTMIAARLLCAIGEKHVYNETVITIDCGGSEFKGKSKTVVSDGWKAVESAYFTLLKENFSKEQDENNQSLSELSEGQTFTKVAAAVNEGATSPPKYFTEDSLLAAMESAGAGDKVNCTEGARESGLGHLPNDAERKGLGTPATRAGIIEKLIKSGFVERRKKNLIPTDKAKNLITILPDTLKSPSLTAEWEQKLKLIERGELTADGFIAEIAEMVRALIKGHTKPNAELRSLFAPVPKGDVIGMCPRCGGAVREGNKGFFCDNHTCGFKMWKESKFWMMKRKPLTAAIAAVLLKDGRIALKNLYSEKTGKSYDATVILDDSGDGYVNFMLEF